MAPEILQGYGYDKGVDWWALGVLIYEIFSGILPFQDDDSKNVFERICEGHLQFHINFEPVVKDLICYLLEADPTKRLGNIKNVNIRNHEFFAMVDWNLMI